MLTGVIFDLDGTLMDSEPVWDLAFKELVEEAGKVYDRSLHLEVLGTGLANASRALKERFDLPQSQEEVQTLMLAKFNRLLRELGPAEKSGATTLLRSLKAAGIVSALATGSDRPIVEYVFEKMGWGDLFDAVVTTDEIEHNKPAPDIYLEAARRLGCDTGTCVAFEDAPNGVKSAKAAGLKVIGVVDPDFMAELPEADKTISSFNEITLDDLHSLTA